MSAAGAAPPAEWRQPPLAFFIARGDEIGSRADTHFDDDVELTFEISERRLEGVSSDLSGGGLAEDLLFRSQPRNGSAAGLMA